MKLEITRSQKKSGLVSKTVTFVLDVKSLLTEEESHLIKEYGLGKELIYDSDSAKAAKAKGGILGLVQNVLSLNITIDSLTRGQTIECKDLGQALDAEQAVKEACQNMKTYLEVAMGFDGAKEVVEI